MQGAQILHVRQGELITLEALPDELPAEGFVWIALTRETLLSQFPALQSHLAHWLQVPLLDLHVSDLLNDQLPSHFEATRAYDLMVLRRLAANRGGDAADWNAAIDTRAVGFAVYERLLLSVHPSECPVRNYFAERLAHTSGSAAPSALRLPASADELMLRMLNHMVDGYLDLRRLLTRKHGEIQLALLDTLHPFADWSGLLAARDALVRLEELCEDQQAAVQEWLDAQLEWSQGKGPSDLEREGLRVRARDVLEHIERVLAHIRRLMAGTESAVQMHYAALGHRTNSIMKVLTALTAVFLPLNLITGIFGMNFDALPLIHARDGVWVALGLMAFVGLGLGWWFRRKRYLGSRI